MGVAKAWRFSVISANLALLQNQNGHDNNTNTNTNTKTNSNSNSNNKHVVCSTTTTTTTTSFQRKPISWSLVCGLMLFGLGLISLFTGHVASDLEWYSQRLVKRSFYSRLVIFLNSTNTHTHTHTQFVSILVSLFKILKWNCAGLETLQMTKLFNFFVKLLEVVYFFVM